MTFTPAEQKQRSDYLRENMTKTPYIEGLGMVVEQWEPAGARIRMPFSAHLTNDGKSHHGGAIASLIDTAGAAAVWAGHDFDKGMKAATVTLTVNYIGGARESDLIADAICIKRGRELSFADIRVRGEDGNPVATGSLVYRIVP